MSPGWIGSSPWWDKPDPTGETSTGERGLRFTCTMCGHCCTGPTGYVLFNDEEGDAMARALGILRPEFDERFTHDTPAGRSLIERRTGFGYDCVFLDREKVPGKAVCGLYEHRPAQCRTWPFWTENLRSPRHWKAAARTCPGMDTGTLHSPETIRLTVERDTGARRA
ncbi:MAG: YkgJ family cysteine cluster protein [Phycisphaeraceae bacterium]|nr:MAG: YkgJ family cysteine cluster protein [Phycisphaeraceae bacterium]